MGPLDHGDLNGNTSGEKGLRHALKILGCKREETAIVGDRMDTDIIAGVEAEITTVLVLSGVTSRTDLRQFAYRPDYILDGVGEIVPKGG